ncbi:MAG: hypothetical protein K2X87_07445 [Gemmataceae bacterium]|nr:hypothetical protein [Gemmataceae bacterium]
MPRVRLTTYTVGSPLQVVLPAGGSLLLPQLQFRCPVRLPGSSTTRDAVIDTGSPYTWIPRDIWRPLRAGIDFDWLPFAAGRRPPVSKMAGWSSGFRMARFLGPVELLDGATTLSRVGVIAQMFDGNPPIPIGSKRPMHMVIGLWGGLLDDTKIAITRKPQTGSVDGVLEF